MLTTDCSLGHSCNDVSAPNFISINGVTFTPAKFKKQSIKKQPHWGSKTSIITIPQPKKPSHFTTEIPHVLTSDIPLRLQNGRLQQNVSCQLTIH